MAKHTELDEVEASASTFVPADKLHEGKAAKKFQATPGFYAAGSAASVMFDDDGFFVTSNDEQIAFIEHLIENGKKISEVELDPKPKKAPKADAKKADESGDAELEALKAKAEEYKIAYAEDADVATLTEAIAAFEKANPKAAGDAGMTTNKK